MADGEIKWHNEITNEEWFSINNTENWLDFYDRYGYLVINNIIEEADLKIYRKIYNNLVTGKVNSSAHRHDLGSHHKKSSKNETPENICQIMWPSHYYSQLRDGPFHSRSCMIAKYLMDKDMEFDFDMMISKAPYSNTAVPMHQDEGYWPPELTDKRAVSVWLGLDDTTLDNGCLWFIPGSHKLPLREHHFVSKGHHAMCFDGDVNEFIAVPITAGSCTFHTGRTAYYSQGNITQGQRRGLIANYRPKAMIELERNIGFDHGLQEGIRVGILEKDVQ